MSLRKNDPASPELPVPHTSSAQTSSLPWNSEVKSTYPYHYLTFSFHQEFRQPCYLLILPPPHRSHNKKAHKPSPELHSQPKHQPSFFCQAHGNASRFSFQFKNKAPPRHLRLPGLWVTRAVFYLSGLVARRLIDRKDNCNRKRNAESDASGLEGGPVRRPWSLK